jgi:hypothetical protein
MRRSVAAAVAIAAWTLAVALYGILTEALTNVRRHAQASTCRLRLYGHAGEAVLEVTDDGRGIGPDPLDGSGAAVDARNTPASWAPRSSWPGLSPVVSPPSRCVIVDSRAACHVWASGPHLIR